MLNTPARISVSRTLSHTASKTIARLLSHPILGTGSWARQESLDEITQPAGRESGFLSVVSFPQSLHGGSRGKASGSASTGMTVVSLGSSFPGLFIEI